MTETMMETAVLSLVWLLLYGYCIEGMGTIQKGRGRRIVAGLISLLLLALSLWIPLWAVWLLEGLTVVLFVLFFDEEPFRQQWKRAAVPALLFACLTAAAAAFENGSLLPAATGSSVWLCSFCWRINGAICGRETPRRWERCACCSPPFRLFLPES